MKYVYRMGFVLFWLHQQHWNRIVICNLIYTSYMRLFQSAASEAVRIKTWRTLQWRHNERDGVSNHQSHDCLFNRLFRHRSKKIPKLCVIGVCAENSLVTGEFPTQRTSNAENLSIWWRHHAMSEIYSATKLWQATTSVRYMHKHSNELCLTTRWWLNARMSFFIAITLGTKVLHWGIEVFCGR